MEKKYDLYDAGTIEVKKKSESLTIVEAIDFFTLLMSKFPGEQFIKYKRNFTPYPQIGDRTVCDHPEESAPTMPALVNGGGTFHSATGGTFHSDMTGTFESDMDGIFNVLQSHQTSRV